MGELTLAHGGLTAGPPLIVFFPFVGLGLSVIFFAIMGRGTGPRRSERQEQRDGSVPSLLTAQEQPLRYVHTSLASHRRALRAPSKDSTDTERTGRRKAGGGTRLRRVV